MAFDKWKNHTIDAYKPLDPSEAEKWLECPRCKERPRTWVFDNGRYAKCCCSDTYGKAEAKAESILSVYRRTGNTAAYNSDDLRKSWNKRVEDLAPPL